MNDGKECNHEIIPKAYTCDFCPRRKRTTMEMMCQYDNKYCGGGIRVCSVCKRKGGKGMDIKTVRIIRGTMTLDPNNITGEEYATLVVNIRRDMVIKKIALVDDKIVITLEKEEVIEEYKAKEPVSKPGMPWDEEKAEHHQY